MPLQKNLNVKPYYADYNPLSDYYKVLFKAGFPVQARELTNSQLMLQNQIETFMSRFLKEGDTVVPGEFGYANSAYVRCSSITQGAVAQDFVGFTVTGVVSGVKAFVNFATPETSDDDITFYVNYESSGTSSEYKTFVEGETLESDTENRFTAVVGVNEISKPITTSPLGQGSLFTVKEGYYYVDGTSVRCDAQTITLDKYSTNPTYSIGFLVLEEFITSAENSALLDNSQGSTNFAAPGADRLKITLTLQKRGLDDDFANPNFIQLAKIEQGQMQGKPDQRVKWAWLYDILAKRTYDESGDYIVTEFPIETLEYANASAINGIFNPSSDGTYPPVPGSGSTTRLTPVEADGKYAIKVSPGEAYVQGYEVGFRNPIYVYGDKPRIQNFRNDANTQITFGYNVAITSLNSSPDFANIATNDISTQGLETITMYRNFTDGYVGDSTQTDAQGYVEPFNAGNPPPVTYHILTLKGTTIGNIPSNSGYTEIYRAGNSCVVTSNTPPKRGDTIGDNDLRICYVETVNPTPSGIMTPRYLMPTAVVDNAIVLKDGAPVDNAGFLGYNSTFDLGIAAAEYFTELFLLDDNSSNFLEDWVIGDLVYGEQTGSFGVIEAGTVYNRLIVSNITGEFAPGENVFQGDKVSKIATGGEIRGFAFTDFGENSSSDLSTENEIKVTAIGAEITLTKGVDFLHDPSTNRLVPTSEGRTKLRNFPYPEGSTLATRINYKLETSPSKVKGYATQVTGKVQNSVAKSKSFFSQQPGQTVVNFTADISIQTTADSEVFPIANNSLFSGSLGDNFITCDDFSGDPADQLDAGDLITFVDDNGVSTNKLVSFATKPVGYGKDRDSAYVYFTTSLEANVSGKTVQRIRIKKKGSAEETLIYQLPQTTVASLQSDPLASGINYSVMQEFVVSLEGGASVVPLNTNKQNETFILNTGQTTITVASVPGDPSDTQGAVGRQLSINAANTEIKDSGRQILIGLNTTLATRSVLKIYIPVYVTNALAKIKTINQDQTLTVSAEDAGRDVISLGVTDATAVTAMVDASGLDIRDNYIFDNGQRDNIYQISRLIRVPGTPLPTSEVTITYDYYSHTGDGDFFSVDSYVNDGGVGYAEVPVFVPSKTIFAGSQRSASIALQLRDCIDFRPVVNTTGATPSILPKITSGRDATGSQNFLGSTVYDGNAVVPRMPVRGSLFICDMAYYMPRVDSIFLENTGALKLVQGVPANEPVAPPDLATGIRLYDLLLPPYTFSLKGVKINKYNYTRYTMADIAGIDSKISRLEDLVTLSILEQSALNMQVRDAVTGLNRFKNGIVVDRFADHAQGAVGQEQYRNSMDPVMSHLRAAHFTDQVELIESDQTPIQRKGNGYRKTGPLLTVDYESLRFMQNPFATRSINLQPYSVFTFDGNMVLTPSVDTFQDITQLPDLVIEDNNLYDAMVNLSDTMAESGIGTTWGDWENTGQTRTSISNKTTIRGDRSTINDAAAALEIMGVNITNRGAAGAIFDLGMQPPLQAFDETTAVQQRREQTRTRIDVSTGSVQRTSYGERVVDVQLARTMRTVPVRVQAGRLKPNTRYYFFFDEIDCSSWFSIDTIQTDFPDGLGRYRGQPGTSQRGFGAPIISDDIGNVSGLFLIPNGRAPVVGSVFTNLNSVQYQTSGETRSFNTGTRRVKITSSPENARDLELVEGFAEATFVSSGVLLDKQETIVATRIPEFGFSSEVVATETRWEETTERKANYFDPVAQTFLVDKINPEGLFVTELDVFFRTKDQVEGVEAYLTTTDGQVPTEQVLPFSRVIKNSDTVLRVICTLGSGQEVATINAGTLVTGQTSGSTGLVKSVMNFSSAAGDVTTNVTNTVYNLLLSNYTGDFLPGEEIVPAVTPAQTATFTIVSDTYEVEDVVLTSIGSGYHAPIVTFSAPQLPGGITATGVVSVGPNGGTTEGDIVYNIEVTNKGSGYTQVPSVTIIDSTAAKPDDEVWTDGTGCTALVNVSDGTPAVDMGVSTSTDASAPTKFKFPAPVYLLSDTNYSFVLKAPTSLNYNVYTSKLGENELGTETRVSLQPNLGSLFKSQNGGLWTEDQTQDIKFVLYRADFQTGAAAEIKLNNAPLRSVKLPLNPIETNADGTDDTSTLFGDNPKIVRVIKDYHGMVKGDLVALSGITGTPGNIPNASLNTVHTVIDAGLRYFTIKVNDAATISERDGGSVGFTSVNRPYEVLNVYTGAMAFGSSTLRAENRATQAAGVTGYNVLNQYSMDTPNGITLMDSYYYNGAKQVANQMNEAKYRGALNLRGQKSMQITCTLATLSSKVSPVIDLDRTNANLVHNLIDDPVYNATEQGVQSATISLKSRTSELSIPTHTPLAFSNGGDYNVTVKSYNATTGQIKVIGQHVEKLKGATYNNATLQSIGADVVTTNGRLFIPETSPNGSSYAKWISRLFLFENPCDGIELKLAVCQYEKTSVRAYYRPRAEGFEGDLTQENWTPFNPTQELTSTNDQGQVIATEYPGLPDDVNNIRVRDRVNVDPREIMNDGWSQLTFTVQDIPAFDAVQVKIVMTSDNPALAPLIDDMQLVCSE